MRYIVVFFIILMMTQNTLFAKKDKPLKDPIYQLREESLFEKMSFWKNTKRYKTKHKEPVKMVETEAEWLNKSKDLPFNKRENPFNYEKETKELKPLKSPNTIFQKYNNPPSTRKVDISNIIANKNTRSDVVIFEDFLHAAVVEYNYHEAFNQITSKLVLVQLDKKKNKEDRINKINYSLKTNKNELDTLNFKYQKDLYSILEIVDFSYDKKRIILKEKIGTGKNGIFRTYLYIVNIDKNYEILSYHRYDELNDYIKNYWSDIFEDRLNFYRWDIKPLGWNTDNEDEVIVIAIGYNKNGNKRFLGAWGVNSKTNEMRLISNTKKQYPISSYGVIKKEFMP